MGPGTQPSQDIGPRGDTIHQQGVCPTTGVHVRLIAPPPPPSHHPLTQNSVCFNPTFFPCLHVHVHAFSYHPELCNYTVHHVIRHHCMSSPSIPPPPLPPPSPPSPLPSLPSSLPHALRGDYSNAAIYYEKGTVNANAPEVGCISTCVLV